VSRRLLLTLTAGPILTLTACGSVSLSADTLSAAEVSDAAEDALEQEVGTRPDVSCPDELPKEKGETTRCTLTAGDDPVKYGVTVTITSVGKSTKIGVEVDKEPMD
jgi:hypothetical protein